MNFSDITVVIVTFKSEHKIFSCLETIPIETKVIIVENSDSEQFKRKVESSGKNIKCYLLNNNYGYATANNFGLKKVNTKYGLVLNPDTRLTGDALKNFLSCASNNDNFWLIGPNQNFNNNYSSKETLEVENIKGYAMLFNMEKFNGKFFDENFFLYFEEIDLCKKIKLNNGIILVDQKTIVEHEGASSVSLKSLHELEINRNWHWMWSTFYFHKKYKGFLLALLIVLPKLFSAFLKTIFFTILNNRSKRIIYFSRISGIYNSILGKKSWYRPRIN